MKNSNSSELVKAIGVVGLAAGIFNCTVGGGIFRLPGVIYETVGPAAPLIYVICGVATLFIMLTFAMVGQKTLSTGGPYAYVEQQFGPYAGFIAGLLVYTLGVLSMASVATALIDNVKLFWPEVGSSAGKSIFLLSVLTFLTAVNILGVKAGNEYHYYNF